MFFRRIGVFLCLERLQGSDDAEACVARLDDIVDVAEFRRIVRICEFVAIFTFFLCRELCAFLGVFYSGDFLAVEDFDGA